MNLWIESGVKWSDVKMNKLKAELNRMARLISVNKVIWEKL